MGFEDGEEDAVGAISAERAECTDDVDGVDGSLGLEDVSDGLRSAEFFGFSEFELEGFSRLDRLFFV